MFTMRILETPRLVSGMKHLFNLKVLRGGLARVASHSSGIPLEKSLKTAPNHNQELLFSAGFNAPGPPKHRFVMSVDYLTSPGAP